jgi:hypothetical protein
LVSVTGVPIKRLRFNDADERYGMSRRQAMGVEAVIPVPTPRLRSGNRSVGSGRPSTNTAPAAGGDGTPRGALRAAHSPW